jgi:hypothetical protein
LEVSPCVQRAILDELRQWAQVTFGDLDREMTGEEAYVVQAVDLRPSG